MCDKRAMYIFKLDVEVDSKTWTNKLCGWLYVPNNVIGVLMW